MLLQAQRLQAVLPRRPPPGSLIFDWEILGLVRATMIKTTDIAIRFQMGLVDWVNNTFIISSDKAQIFFQIVIVLSEIAVGLLLIGGLLTTIASLYSLLLQGLFVTTTGLYLSTWWMVFAAIAVIIGGGRIFGLDYYVMPWLKKALEKYEDRPKILYLQ